MSEKFYLTTAIAYASRKPHFGNTYEVILTDAVARYQRACGKPYSGQSQGGYLDDEQHDKDDDPVNWRHASPSFSSSFLYCFYLLFSSACPPRT